MLHAHVLQVLLLICVIALAIAVEEAAPLMEVAQGASPHNAPHIPDTAHTAPQIAHTAHTPHNASHVAHSSVADTAEPIVRSFTFFGLRRQRAHARTQRAALPRTRQAKKAARIEAAKARAAKVTMPKDFESEGSSRRELLKVPDWLATVETLPTFEKKLIYHKHEAVHQAEMTEDAVVETTTNRTNKEGVGMLDDSFLESPVMENRDNSNDTEFSPASSSSSPSFNANEGMPVPEGTLRLRHNMHKPKFEAMRQTDKRQTHKQTHKQTDKPVLTVTSPLGARATYTTLSLEGPSASPPPPSVTAPPTPAPTAIMPAPTTAIMPAHTTAIMPAHTAAMPAHSAHSSSGAVVASQRPHVSVAGLVLSSAHRVHAGVSHVRGAVIAGKRRRSRGTRRNRAERDQKRAEREAKRDQVRRQRQERHKQRQVALGHSPLNESSVKRSPKGGAFGWASWFEEDTTALLSSGEDIEEGEDLAFWPMTEEMYRTDFGQGDISEDLWEQCLTDPTQMQGSWQVQLNRSDSISPILAELGLGRMKRTIVAAYPSIVKMNVLSHDPAHQPKIHIVTQLPMGITKQATIEFNGQSVTQPDSDTGAWETLPYYVNGRAMQRRVNARGVMFDVRCAFPSDPAGVIPGKVMLFQWTFIPNGKPPLVSRRWLQMV
eukprot:GHVS01080906.1.p1 GENE.GHVS01080906.1~~GHVS01080906.1.p1  ORF type:complete len:659 (+),score=118.53 GHVS01080906.1:480-2456(+)